MVAAGKLKEILMDTYTRVLKNMECREIFFFYSLETMKIKKYNEWGEKFLNLLFGTHRELITKNSPPLTLFYLFR